LVECGLRQQMLPDFITGKPVKETPKELVRQEVARALLQEYRISADDMEPDFAVKVEGKRRKIDIAVFCPGQPHTEEHLERAIVCRPQPKVGKQLPLCGVICRPTPSSPQVRAAPREWAVVQERFLVRPITEECLVVN
jgi:hypothetical protein